MNSLSKNAPGLFTQALGDAVVRLWSRLPQHFQQQLFEAALTAEHAGMRAQLATFLHEHHTRTTNGVAAKAMIEPDSLGG